ncbi:alternative ribosome rescue aminoacyl-tRNA hydrolase ArfB [Hufsiella ginkgonis]|uniref:Aminoacyl-tRNA hydrolase n=1 Tax=Hufsiella ginkgonis TaxID=2695274 RepID=A0A7K1XYE3_9SPHI|nr:alternative ribosome rescue aminoacyl-tRNA hydrolase ArfB [Hufsiella ginkgonis]MXV15848.1 aminoacyl-tRNA hydrolase [Hufsiella ginkgonis]
MIISEEALLPYISFKTSRSGGKGGQHVNKVSSKVELNFDVEASALFTPGQKDRIREKLAHRLTANGMVQVISEADRSQYKNKADAIERLIVLIVQALHQQKQRKPTKPSRQEIANRVKDKQQKALKKIMRRKNFPGE